MLSPRALPWLVCLAGVLAIGPLVAGDSLAEPDARRAAVWKQVGYPEVEVPALPGSKLMLDLISDLDPKKSTIGVNLQCRGGSETAAFEESGRLAVRLHYADGRVIAPNRDSATGPITIALGSGAIHVRTYYFPFGHNELEEAWLELQIDGHVLWYEIPYGFTRDPSASLPPSAPQAPPPGYAPSMKDSPKGAQIVRWGVVKYDFGVIQNGWKLSVALEHRGDIIGLVRLRRDEGEWDLHSPVVKMRLAMDNGGELVPQQIAARAPKRSPREDEFAFDFKPLEGRGWGNLIVTVDGQPYGGVISLGPFLEGLWPDPWEH